MELWFKHKSGWHEDQKLVNLIIETGYEGYGVYSVLLELLLSQGGSLELNYKKLNYTVRCSTEVLKRVITQFDLFEIVTDEKGRVFFYADWMLREIEKAKKTSQARSASGKKGLRNRYGAKKASELANTVGVPDSDNLTKANQNVANAIANADFDERRLDKIRDNDIDDVGCCLRAHEGSGDSPKAETETVSAGKPLKDHLAEMVGDKAWHASVVASLRQKGVAASEEQLPSLAEEFVQFQTARGKELEQMTLTQAKAWFFNWLMYQIEKAKKNDYNNNSVTPATGNGGHAAPAVATGRAGYRKSYAEQIRESKEKLIRDTIDMLRNGEL